MYIHLQKYRYTAGSGQSGGFQQTIEKFKSPSCRRARQVTCSI